MSTNSLIRPIATALAIAATSVLNAVEPWADPALTPPASLEMWLDASRTAAGEKPLKSGDQRAVWHDASGMKRHAMQANAKLQPRLLQVSKPGSWVVRFDGEDDHFRVLGINQKWTNFTLFVVAAPHSNYGGFRGFFAFNQTNRRDYETGFTLDLNGPGSVMFQDLNLEGRGFGGARSLMKTTAPFGTLHVLEAVADAQHKQVRLTFDGKPAGQREFSPTELIADEITVGARYFENGPGPQRVQGFLHGDIAEVLLFSRVLTDSESKTVRDYLDAKHATLKESLPRELKVAAAAENAEPLVAVANPPPVQMLVPGFSVREVPVDLTNLNNLRYRPDGKLYALGYNGNVWLLSDTNDDGVPDASTQFFDNMGRLRGPIGMQVIPRGHALLPNDVARGVVVASKGKVSALLDIDGDDVAETERIIASGWKEIVQNVDAIGVAIHPDDGSIYFGLGVEAYNNAYLLDEKGKSAFDLATEHGTIQRIAPDLSSRTTVCTGVRFTIGMGFNADQELFVTDQEGATWMPNGNPFDELLHIRPGRHYGFPPRHPKHLPNVLDEPSTFDYAPQHQSTCGMAFNHGSPGMAIPGSPGSAIFGPESWRGDLFVCGESRGKLYRTKLVRQADGDYVAQNQLIACLSMLTVDCCLSPRGDLLVACHSGGPDWGTGPSGKGKIFLIRYEDTAAPQPMAVWAAGPQEVRVAFDRPLDPQHLKNLADNAKITYGQYVAAGDRFESIRPGYAVTQMQVASPRFKLPIYGASVTPDRKVLILSTAPHPAAVQYALTLPGLGRKFDGSTRDPGIAIPGLLRQHPEIDLAYSLNGVQATWEPRDQSQRGWSGWLPHLDLDVCRQFKTGDAEQDRLFELLEQPGTLTLETQIDPRGLLYPAVQPGSKLDYDRTEDRWIREQSIEIRSLGGVLRVDHAKSPGTPPWVVSGDGQMFQIALDTQKFEPVAVKFDVKTGLRAPTTLALNVSWHATLGDGEKRSGPLALQRFVLPWAKINPEEMLPKLTREIPELAGASWGRGRRVFFSEEAGCAKCHVAHQQGGRIGADLSNLIHRDYASVLRDITLPSFAINPDFITYAVAMKDGRVLTGAVRNEGGNLLIGDKDGKVTTVAQADVDEFTASTVSIMPEGLPQKLGPQRMKDLLAFLLLEPPHMPKDAVLPPPPSRKRSEVAAVLAGSEKVSRPRPLNVLLVAGAKDHGPGEHDYPAWLRVWSELLAGAESVNVSTAMEWPSAEQLQAADTIAFFQKGSWTAERAQAIDAHLAKGGGLVYIHWAVEAGPEAPAFAQRIGLASHAAKLKFRHGPLDLGFETGRDHPIGRNFDRVHFHDESYWQMQGDPSRIRVIATGIEDGAPQPLFWTFEPSQGRVFVSILGHYSWTFDDPLFRVLLLRGIAWTAKEPVDRFNELSIIGVPLAD